MEQKINASQALRQLALRYQMMKLVGLTGWLALLFTLLLLGALSLSGCAARPGQRGPQGAAGAKGDPGAPGAAGSSCSVSQNLAGASVMCTDGTFGFVSNGTNGLQGQQGATGVDATPVTAVQLCPDVVPTYASVFPEFAICIGGHLFGTYNANTSYQYFSQLPDGAYSSNGQGAACSFSISGCQVTP